MTFRHRVESAAGSAAMRGRSKPFRWTIRAVSQSATSRFERRGSPALPCTPVRLLGLLMGGLAPRDANIAHQQFLLPTRWRLRARAGSRAVAEGRGARGRCLRNAAPADSAVAV